MVYGYMMQIEKNEIIFLDHYRDAEAEYRRAYCHQNIYNMASSLLSDPAVTPDMISESRVVMIVRHDTDNRDEMMQVSALFPVKASVTVGGGQPQPVLALTPASLVAGMPFR